MPRPTKYSESDYIIALQEAAKELGESPSIKQYNKLNKKPSSKRIREVFSGWNRAKEEADLETNTSSKLENSEGPPEILDISDDDWKNISKGKRLEYRKRAKWAREKINRGCNECGYDAHPVSLEWHHKNDKYKSISQMINQTYGQKRIEEEVEKCIVLCSNCHKIETWGDRYSI